MKLAAVGVDSGNWTHDVYNYTRARRHRNIYAVKGVHQFGRQLLSRPTRQDFKRNGAVIKAGAELYTVASTTAKQHLYARLASDGRRPPHDRVEHFSADLEDDFFQQLTAEIYDPNKRLYVKQKDRRNEALDGTNYAEAIAHHPCIRVHAMREVHWKQLRAAFEPGGAAQGDLFQAAPPATPATETTAPAPPVSHETTAAPAITGRRRRVRSAGTQ
jgi:phage terminase large subunit GpA-like protein